MRGDLAAAPPTVPVVSTIEQPAARPATLREVARRVGPGTPGEAIGLAAALLVAVIGQQLLGQRPLVVPVLGACAAALLTLRLLTQPRRPPPLRRPPVAPLSGDQAPAVEARTAQEAPELADSLAPERVGGAAGDPAPPTAAILSDGPTLSDAGGAAAAADPAATRLVAAARVPRAAAKAASVPDVWWLLGATPRERWLRAALLLGVLVWVQMRGRATSADYGPVVATWLAAIAAAAVAAAPWPLPAPRRWAAGLRALPRTDWLLLGGVTLGALLLRAVWINHVPYVFGGDEGSQALAALDVVRGGLRNPFGTGWFALPTLYFFLQAAAMAVGGETVGGVRLLSAVVGALAVLVTYLLARRLFDRTVALTAAVLLAVFHYAVLYSRLATVPIADSLLIVAALYFLDRALVERRPLDALAAGLAIGLGEYASAVAARVLPLVGVAYLLYAALWDAERLAPCLPRRADWRHLAPTAGWAVLGALLVYLPLLAHYADFPTEYTARVEQVSIFRSGWLAHEQQTTGQGAVALVAQHVAHAVLLPITAVPSGWYMGITPTVAVPLALLPAIGLMVVTLGAWRRRYFGLAAAYWSIALVLGLSDDPGQPQRFVIVTSVMAVITALGLCGPLRLAAWLGDLPPAVTNTALAAVLLGLGVWNFQTVFHNPDPIAYYGTENGLVATELAYYLRGLGPGTTVYLFGAPRIYYRSFATVPFIAPGANGIDVEQSLPAGAPPLALNGPTVFAFLPERTGELQQVRAWYPDGALQQIRSPQDAPVLTLYQVNGS